MNKKYEFTGETMIWSNTTLKRIRYLSTGILGGWIEKEENLSQEGECWVGDSAKVFDSARVYDSAKVFGKAQVFGNAQVFDLAQISDSVQIFDTAKVHGSAWIYDSAQVFGSAWVFNSAQVYGKAKIFNLARVMGTVRVLDSASVSGEVQVHGLAWVSLNAKIEKSEDIIVLHLHPYPVTFTRQTISIGCQGRSRFGAKQWKITDDVPEKTEELIRLYKPILSFFKKKLPRTK